LFNQNCGKMEFEVLPAVDIRCMVPLCTAPPCSLADNYQYFVENFASLVGVEEAYCEKRSSLFLRDSSPSSLKNIHLERIALARTYKPLSFTSHCAGGAKDFGLNDDEILFSL
jgi:hypothetical protein